MLASNEKLRVRVASVSTIAKDIKLFTLMSATEQSLPAFTPGAHISVRIAESLVRQYSICSSPSKKHLYEIAVLREPDGRGGSEYLHDKLAAGDVLSILPPQNFFELTDTNNDALLIAGGIGITPVMPMIESLQDQGRDFHLYYCTKSPESTAFLDRLRPVAEAGKLTLHHDGGDPARSLDLKDILKQVPTSTDLYYCGPSGMMDAIRQFSTHWPRNRVHFEYFSKEPSKEAFSFRGEAFEVHLARAGVTITVAENESIVEAAARHGVKIVTSCKDGYCGTCLTRYTSGEALHTDEVLPKNLRDKYLLACCARAKTGHITLDI